MDAVGKESSMVLIARSLSLIMVAAWVTYGAAEGTISGTVQDPTGAPFQGAFVRAQNAKTKITTVVLSDRQGRYRAENLPPGEYQVRATAIGYTEDARSGVQVAAVPLGGTASLDFALQKGTVRWSDLTTYQGRQLLPKTEKVDLAKGGQYPSDPLFQSCFRSCHSFQTRMRSEEHTAE